MRIPRSPRVGRARESLRLAGRLRHCSRSAGGRLERLVVDRCSNLLGRTAGLEPERRHHTSSFRGRGDTPTQVPIRPPVADNGAERVLPRELVAVPAAAGKSRVVEVDPRKPVGACVVDEGVAVAPPPNRPSEGGVMPDLSRQLLRSAMRICETVRLLEAIRRQAKVYHPTAGRSARGAWMQWRSHDKCTNVVVTTNCDAAGSASRLTAGVVDRRWIHPCGASTKMCARQGRGRSSNTVKGQKRQSRRRLST